MKREKKQQFVLCRENKDCADLEKRKVYEVIPDANVAREGYLRIIDESGGDYLYPQSYFILVPLPNEAQKALRVAKQLIMYPAVKNTGTIPVG